MLGERLLTVELRNRVNPVKELCVIDFRLILLKGSAETMRSPQVERSSLNDHPLEFIVIHHMFLHFDLLQDKILQFDCTCESSFFLLGLHDCLLLNLGDLCFVRKLSI